MPLAEGSICFGGGYGRVLGRGDAHGLSPFRAQVHDLLMFKETWYFHLVMR